MLDLTQRDENTMLEVKFADNDIVEFDCFELLEKMQEKSVELTRDLRRRIDSDDAELAEIYGRQIPLLPETEENAAANFNIGIENSDRAESIVAAEATKIEIDAFRAVLGRTVPMSAIVRILNAVKERAGVFAASKKK